MVKNNAGKNFQNLKANLFAAWVQRIVSEFSVTSSAVNYGFKILFSSQ